MGLLRALWHPIYVAYVPIRKLRDDSIPVQDRLGRDRPYRWHGHRVLVPVRSRALLRRCHWLHDPRFGGTRQHPPAILHLLNSPCIREPVFLLQMRHIVELGIRAVQVGLLLGPLLALYPIFSSLDRLSAKWPLFRRPPTSLWFSAFLGALQWSGPTFLKGGQWASTRPDLVPPDWCHQLSVLHHHAPTHPFAWTRAVLAMEGLDLDALFDVFDPEPIGSGCIAQVYKARLRETGAWVAVKVCHPNIGERLSRDLLLMRVGAVLLETLIPTLGWLHMPEEVDQFAASMLQQADLRLEAHHLLRFRAAFDPKRHGSFGDQIRFPKPIFPLVTRQVLVESYEPGLPLQVFLSDEAADPSLHSSDALQHTVVRLKEEIVRLGFHSFLKMMLLDNFTHADLHPGNMLVQLYEVERAPLSLIQSVARRLYQSTPVKDYLPAVVHAGLRFIMPNWMAMLEEGSRIHESGAGADRSSHLYTQSTASRRRILSKRLLQPPASARARSPRQVLLDTLGTAAHPERVEATLTFLDVGLVTSLDTDHFGNFRDLFRTVLLWRDGCRAGKVLIQRAPNVPPALWKRPMDPAHDRSAWRNIFGQPQDPSRLFIDPSPLSWAALSAVNPDVVDPQSFCAQVDRLIARFFADLPMLGTAPLLHCHVGPVIADTLALVRQHHVRLDDQYTNLLVSVIFVEGLGRTLCPELDLMPFLRQAAIHYFLRQ